MYHLLRAHPDGMVAGEIQNKLGMQAFALSHQLEKLKTEDLVRVRLLSFLFSQCCAETCVVEPNKVFYVCRPAPAPRRRD